MLWPILTFWVIIFSVVVVFFTMWYLTTKNSLKLSDRARSSILYVHVLILASLVIGVSFKVPDCNTWGDGCGENDKRVPVPTRTNGVDEDERRLGNFMYMFRDGNRKRNK